MKKSLGVVAVALLVLASGFLWWRWRQDEPRRHCLASLQQLDVALHSANAASVLELIVQPAALQARTPGEQAEFIRKALRDELSRDGIDALQKNARFGLLKELFPQEAQAWAGQADVPADQCLAFRFDRQDGLRAEVVLARPSGNQHPASGIGYRILRLNNVKSLATQELSTTNRQP
jgi:hypothetical protein